MEDSGLADSGLDSLVGSGVGLSLGFLEFFRLKVPALTWFSVRRPARVMASWSV